MDQHPSKSSPRSRISSCIATQSHSNLRPEKTRTYSQSPHKRDTSWNLMHHGEPFGHPELSGITGKELTFRTSLNNRIVRRGIIPRIAHCPTRTSPSHHMSNQVAHSSSPSLSPAMRAPPAHNILGLPVTPRSCRGCAPTNCCICHFQAGIRSLSGALVVIRLEADSTEWMCDCRPVCSQWPFP
jgi:hypothetical protein